MRRSVLFTILSLAALLGLTGCPPTPPCDEKISDPGVYRERILANPALRQVESSIPFEDVSLSECFVDGQLNVTIRSRLPDSWSAYGIVYRDQLRLSYTRDGSLQILDLLNSPKDLDEAAAAAYFQKRISMLEGNARIQELIAKTGPDPANPVVPLMNGEMLRSGNNRAQYSFAQDFVFTYTISNDIEWQAYPEVGLAQRAIRDNLLVGELSSCSIGRGGGHAYTSSVADSETGPWFVTVALICSDGWKDASVRINRGGSFEELKVKTDY